MGRGQLWLGMEMSLAGTLVCGNTSPAWERDMGYPGNVCTVGRTRLSSVPLPAGAR